MFYRVTTRSTTPASPFSSLFDAVNNFEQELMTVKNLNKVPVRLTSMSDGSQKIEFQVPGVSNDNLDLTVDTDHVLLVIKQEEKEDNDKVFEKEVKVDEAGVSVDVDEDNASQDSEDKVVANDFLTLVPGAYRKVVLNNKVDPSKAEANLQDGILTVLLPASSITSKKIKVTVK